jgi:hypothetical protein
MLLMTPVVVIQGFIICSLVGKNTCCHSDLSHCGVFDFCVTAAVAAGEEYDKGNNDAAVTMLNTTLSFLHT